MLELAFNFIYGESSTLNQPQVTAFESQQISLTTEDEIVLKFTKCLVSDDTPVALLSH